MSDEYHDSGNYKGSLVQESIKDSVTNQPPPGDTTSEGGYGGDVFSRQSQRGTDPFADPPRSDPRSQNNIPGGPEGRTGDHGLSGKIYPQATEFKSKDHTGDQNQDDKSRSNYEDRRGEGYLSSAAGRVDSSEING
ncbi:hypothetical protein M422DRAFT_244814 [Sphaerobolus stellatus SS14]|nr:hypothetical protein M422DRAFT_244814 [Sphaerobolus stellatus SS14]